ncbi:glycoside hydrolase family 1 protein [Clostridium sp. CTA-5]
MSVQYKFLENFLWGAATSGPQSEGRFDKKHDNIFDYWYDVEPEMFFNNVGPDRASNFYNDYKRDIKLMKEIGLNSFRTSIQWTRLIKDFETGEIDEDGAIFYNAVIDECIANNIIPIINLHHFDLPVELYDKYGGWESKHVVELFVIFAEKCFELFSDKVKYWTTFNEPMVIVEGQYLYKFHYPKIVDSKRAAQAIYNLNLASAKSIQAFRKMRCDNEEGKIGIILNLTPAYPRSNNVDDIVASEIVDSYFNKSFLEPAVKGYFPDLLVEMLRKDNILWESTDDELEIINKNTIDFLGVNYYQPRRVKAKESQFDEKNVWLPDKYFDNYKMPGRRMNLYRGWEIYPQCMYDIAINIRDNYNNIPWYISENGMGVEDEEKYINKDGMIEDDYRIDFYKEHLSYLHKGIIEGSNCFGYHAWTSIDCWSWCNAYKNRYGFIALDLDTQVKTIKKSGRWIKKVSENNGF